MLYRLKALASLLGEGVARQRPEIGSHKAQSIYEVERKGEARS